MADQDLEPWMRRTSGLRGPRRQVRMSTPGGPPREEIVERESDPDVGGRFHTSGRPETAQQLTLFLPGAGDLYLGRDARGAALLGLFIVLLAITVSGLLPAVVGVLLLVAVWSTANAGIWSYLNQ